MSALSELLLGSSIAPARAIERIEKSDEYSMNRATIYRYVEGDHPERPKEKYLQALAYGFGVPITKVRQAAAAAPGELGPWTPPLESGRLSKPVRDALDFLIQTLAKEGIGNGVPPAQKIDEKSGLPTTDAIEVDLDPGTPAPLRPPGQEETST